MKYIGYVPGNSFIHRLSPLTKLVILILGGIFIVSTYNPFIALWTLAFILLFFDIANINARKFLGRVKILPSFTLLLFIIQIFVNHDGNFIAYLIPEFVPVIGGNLPLTSGGVLAGIAMGLRFLNIILGSYLFIATTYPADLGYALMRVGIPYRYAFTFVLALRFVPLFSIESSIVRNAQKARGIEIDIKGIKAIIKSAKYMFFPLIITALSRVQSLVVSMDGRAFGAYSTRTFLHESQTHKIDYILTIFIMCLFVLWIINGWHFIIDFILLFKAW